MTITMMCATAAGGHYGTAVGSIDVRRGQGTKTQDRSSSVLLHRAIHEPHRRVSGTCSSPFSSDRRIVSGDRPRVVLSLRVVHIHTPPSQIVRSHAQRSRPPLVARRTAAGRRVHVTHVDGRGTGRSPISMPTRSRRSPARAARPMATGVRRTRFDRLCAAVERAAARLAERHGPLELKS